MTFVLCVAFFKHLPFLVMCLSKSSHLQISSSEDGTWCLWDVEAGQRLKEVSWNSPLTSICSLVSRFSLVSIQNGQKKLDNDLQPAPTTKPRSPDSRRTDWLKVVPTLAWSLCHSVFRTSMWSLAVRKEDFMFGCGKLAQTSATLPRTISVFTTALSYQTQVHSNRNFRSSSQKCPDCDSCLSCFLRQPRRTECVHCIGWRHGAALETTGGLIPVSFKPIWVPFWSWAFHSCLCRWRTWTPSRVTVAPSVESFAEKEWQNSSAFQRTVRCDAGRGRPVCRSYLLLLTGSSFTLLTRVMCLFRRSSCTQEPSLSSVLLSTGWCSSRWLWVRVDGDLAQPLPGWPQAGEDSDQSNVRAECFLLVNWLHGVSASQTSDYGITAICAMPENQFAVSYLKPVVDVFKLVWNQQRNSARYEKQPSCCIRPSMSLFFHLQFCEKHGFSRTDGI